MPDDSKPANESLHLHRRCRKVVLRFYCCGPAPSVAIVWQVEPLLKVMGSSILDCGDAAKAGSIMKLVGNFTFMSYVETVSEALAMADAGGLPRSSVTTFLDRIFPGFVTKGGAFMPHLYLL